MKTRVRLGRPYRYQPVGFDRFDPKTTARPGDVLIPVALPGCPRPGTMGHTHVTDAEGHFAGLVLIASLTRVHRLRVIRGGAQ